MKIKCGVVAATLFIVVYGVSPINAARLYFTASNSLPGGGSPMGGVPIIGVDHPGEEITLYVWLALETNTFMAGYGLDIRATNPGVFEVVHSEVYNPTILAIVGSEQFPFQARWRDILHQPKINPEGAGEATLTSGVRALTVNFSGRAGIGFDGTIPDGLFLSALDPLYDSESDAFLVQSVTLRALPGTEGQTTHLIMSIGEFAFSLDNSVYPVPLYFGAGTAGVLSDRVGSSDGTIHATLVVSNSGDGTVPEPGSLPIVGVGLVGVYVAWRTHGRVKP